MNISFEEENHIYTDLDRNVEVPSVTKILKSVGLKSGWEHPDSDWYKERGKAIHKACELYLKNELDFETLDDNIKPYLAGFLKFIEESGFQYSLIEQVVYHKFGRYAGTVDLLGMLNDNYVVIDIKSGVKEKWHRIQTMAYYHAVNDTFKNTLKNLSGRFALYLKKNGKYSLERHTNPIDSQVWYAALDVYKFKNGGSK